MNINQKVEDMIDNIMEDMGETLRMDKRTMSNPESENGWLFDKIDKWKKELDKILLEL